MSDDSSHIKINGRVTVQYGKKWRNTNPDKMYYMDGTIKNWDQKTKIAVIVFDDEGESWESLGEIQLVQIWGKIFNDSDGWAVKVTKQKSAIKKKKRFLKAAKKVGALSLLAATSETSETNSLGANESKGQPEYTSISSFNIKEEPRSLIEERKMRKAMKEKRDLYEKKKEKLAAEKLKKEKKSHNANLAIEREKRDNKFIEAEEKRIQELARERQIAAAKFAERQEIADREARKRLAEEQTEAKRVEDLLKDGRSVDVASIMAQERKIRQENELKEKLAAGRFARARLNRFYREHAPKMVNKVDAIASKYAGRENRLYLALAKKYGSPVAEMSLEELELFELQLIEEEKQRKQRENESNQVVLENSLDTNAQKETGGIHINDTPSHPPQPPKIHINDDKEVADMNKNKEVADINNEKEVAGVNNDKKVADVEEEFGPDGKLYLVDKIDKIVYTHDVNDPHPIGRWDETRNKIVLGDTSMHPTTTGDYDYEYEYDFKSVKREIPQDEAEVEEEIGPDGKLYLVDKTSKIVYTYNVDEPETIGTWKNGKIILEEESPIPEAIPEELVKVENEKLPEEVDEKLVYLATSEEQKQLAEFAEKPLSDFNGELARLRKIEKDKKDKILALEIQEEIDFEINLEFKKRTFAATQMQSVIRGHSGRSKVRKLRASIKQRNDAATLIQSVNRRNVAKDRVSRYRIVTNRYNSDSYFLLDNASTKLQSMARSRFAQRRCALKRHGNRKRERAATKLQSRHRGIMAREDIRKQRNNTRNRQRNFAAATIQKRVRGNAGRVSAEETRKTRHWQMHGYDDEERKAAIMRFGESIRLQAELDDDGNNENEDVRQKQEQARMQAKYGRSGSAMSVLLPPTEVLISGVLLSVSGKIIKASGDVVIEAIDKRHKKPHKSVIVVAGPDVRHLVTDASPELLIAERGSDRVIALCALMSYDGYHLVLTGEQNSDDDKKYQYDERLNIGPGLRQAISRGGTAVGLLPDIIEDEHDPAIRMSEELLTARQSTGRRSLNQSIYQDDQYQNVSNEREYYEYHQGEKVTKSVANSSKYPADPERMYRLDGDSQRAGGLAGTEWGRHGPGMNIHPSYKDQMRRKENHFQSRVYPEITRPETPPLDFHSLPQSNRDSEYSYEQLKMKKQNVYKSTPRPKAGQFGQAENHQRSNNVFSSQRNGPLTKIDRTKREQMRLLQKTMAAAEIQERRRALNLKLCSSQKDRYKLEKKYALERARSESEIMTMLALTKIPGDEALELKTERMKNSLSKQSDKLPYRLKDLLRDVLNNEYGQLTFDLCRKRNNKGKPFGTGRERKKEIINKTWDSLNQWLLFHLEKRKNIKVPFFGEMVWKKVVPGSKYYKSITLTDVPVPKPLPSSGSTIGSTTHRSRRRRRRHKKNNNNLERNNKKSKTQKFKEIDPGDVRIFRPVFIMDTGFRQGFAPPNAAKLDKFNKKIARAIARRSGIKVDDIVNTDASSSVSVHKNNGKHRRRKDRKDRKGKRHRYDKYDVDKVLYAIIDIFGEIRKQYRCGRHLQIDFDIGIFHARRNPIYLDTGIQMSARSGFDTTRSKLSTGRLSKDMTESLDYTFQFEEAVIEEASGHHKVELTPKQIDRKLRELYKKYPRTGFAPCGALHPPRVSKAIQNHDRAHQHPQTHNRKMKPMNSPFPAPFIGNGSFMSRI